MLRKTSIQFSDLRKNFINLSLAKRFIWVGAVVLILLGAWFAYYKLVSVPATQSAAAQPALQTAVVRQGDLILYASGTGTLIASDQANLAFKTGGQITAINVAVGDQVKAGDILAQVDDGSAQIALTQAQRTLTNLTSPSAIATAQEAMATAAGTVQSTRDHLRYLISPTVLHWEEEVAKAQQAVQQAQTALDANPSDASLQKKVAEAQAVLSSAQASLVGAQASYTVNYLPGTFTVRVVDRVTHKTVTYVAAPTDSEILAARAAYAAALAAMDEATYLYNTLVGTPIPDDATGAGLNELEQAHEAVQSAQAALDGTRLVAPLAGTVMSIAASLGDTVGASTVIITIADLTQPALDIFLDPSDWANIRVGYPVEVTFDISPDTIFNGKVTVLDPGLYASNNSSVVHAIVRLDLPAGSVFNLPLGTTASVDVIGGSAKGAVLVPIEALHKAGDQYTVFVIQNGKLALRVVVIGIQDANNAEVISGLQAGDVVSTGITQTTSSQ